MGYLLAVFIVPGIVLGFILPREDHAWWLSIVAIAGAYSIVTMLVELVRGKAMANSWRRHLAAELDAPEDSDIVAAAVLRASVTHQFIYRFHLPAFVVGCLTIAVPVAVLAAATYGLRWLSTATISRD